MNIVFFSNPNFFGNQQRPQFSSMPRFTKMLADGMNDRGHEVKVWTPESKFFKFPMPAITKKWMGYVDQYIVFPAKVRQLLKNCSDDTLFVFTDQAQGPWVPLVADRNHVIHCHDFLAQSSALGKIAENKTSWTGRQYQHMIHRGYSMGKNFISVSKKTEEELMRLLPNPPLSSNVVYNGLNKSFIPHDTHKARQKLSIKTGLFLSQGYILHVGGNQWYKNRKGVIEIYNAWRSIFKTKLPLLLIGDEVSHAILKTLEKSPFKEDIHLFTGFEDEYVNLAYAAANVLLFPSLAEGFGWPIAEAMASGCLVITTNETPMTEVAGNEGFFIPRQPANKFKANRWAEEAAKVVNKVVKLSSVERKAATEASIINSKRFDLSSSLDSIEAIYYKINQARA